MAHHPLGELALEVLLVDEEFPRPLAALVRGERAAVPGEVALPGAHRVGLDAKVCCSHLRRRVHHAARWNHCCAAAHCSLEPVRLLEQGHKRPALCCQPLSLRPAQRRALLRTALVEQVVDVAMQQHALHPLDLVEAVGVGLLVLLLVPLAALLLPPHMPLRAVVVAPRAPHGDESASSLAAHALALDGLQRDA